MATTYFLGKVEGRHPNFELLPVVTPELIESANALSAAEQESCEADRTAFFKKAVTAAREAG